MRNVLQNQRKKKEKAFSREGVACPGIQNNQSPKLVGVRVEVFMLY